MGRVDIDPFNEEDWGYDRRERRKKIFSIIKSVSSTLILLIIFAFCIYGVILDIKTPTIDNQFHNEKLVIVDKNIETKGIMMRRVSDTTYYTEMKSSNAIDSKQYGSNWDAFYYNHKIGDTLFYVDIKKDRFFQAINGINK